VPSHLYPLLATATLLLLAATTMHNSHLPPKIEMAAMSPWPRETGARAPISIEKVQARAWWLSNKSQPVLSGCDPYLHVSFTLQNSLRQSFKLKSSNFYSSTFMESSSVHISSLYFFRNDYWTQVHYIIVESGIKKPNICRIAAYLLPQ